MSILKNYLARLVLAVFRRSGVEQDVPVEMPSIGEVWRTTGPDGAATVGVIVDYYPAEESVVLLGRTGRTARMPVRSLRLTWTLIHDVDLTHVCGHPGCTEQAFLHYDGAWCCHRHLRPNEPAAVIGEDRVPDPSTVPASASSAPTMLHELVLDTCPVCGETSDQGLAAKSRGWACPSCACSWKAVHPDTHRDVLKDVVTRLHRSWRTQLRKADIIRVCSDHMSVVIDNSARSRRDIVIKGSPGGEDPTLCGLLVVPTEGNLTVLISQPPLNRCFVHVPTGKLLVQRGRVFYGFTDSAPVKATDVRPWAEIVPPVMSHWRNTSISGSSLQVVGTSLNQQGCLIVQGSEQEKLLLTEVLEQFTRFDRAAAPAIGSIWQQRGASHHSLVVRIQMQADLPYVELKSVTVTLDEVAGTGHLLHVPDLWRNYEEVQAECQPIPAEITGEWETDDGRSAYVISTDPNLGTVQVQVAGESRTVLARVFARWTRVERMTAFERLMDDD